MGIETTPTTAEMATLRNAGKEDEARWGLKQAKGLGVLLVYQAGKEDEARSRGASNSFIELLLEEKVV